MGTSAKEVRDISYAASARSRAGRGVIRTVENLTGRPKLIRMAEGYEAEIGAGADFWQVMVRRYALGLDIRGGSLANLPAGGPLVVVANHPFGVLDGLMLGHIMSRARGDFRILANSVFRKVDALDRVILPISFDETADATALNLATRRESLGYLAAGGCIGIFPGGTVSTARRPFGRPMDPSWRRFAAKLIQRTGAAVVPVYFDGQNSRLFQIASHLHMTLRLSLLIGEFRARVGEAVPVVIGEAVPASELAAFAGDPAGLMEHLRRATYALSPAPIADPRPGFDFELGR